MKYFLIIVEGAHDIATVERILRMQGIDKCIKHKSDLPDVWKRMIPERFPFQADLLDRITPLPSFWQNESVSVAIKNAGSDVRLISCLKEICQSMKISEKAQLDFRIMRIQEP